jgi:hypothetical protein
VWRGGRVMIGDTKEQIVEQLNSLIYEGDGDFSLSDIEDIIGDGDIFEYM